MASGKMTRLMVSESTITRTELDMRVTGSRTSSMAMAKKSGLTTLVMKDSTETVRNTAEDSSSGLMAQHTPASSWRTTFMVMECTPGPMEDNTTVSGKTTKWTAQECSHGPMAESTKANMLTIRKRDTVFSPGQMDVNTMETGKMESSTDSEFTIRAKAKSREENGTKVNVSLGLTRQQSEKFFAN